jgi:hypothetical protein
MCNLLTQSPRTPKDGGRCTFRELDGDTYRIAASARQRINAVAKMGEKRRVLDRSPLVGRGVDQNCSVYW